MSHLYPLPTKRPMTTFLSKDAAVVVVKGNSCYSLLYNALLMQQRFNTTPSI